MVSRNRNTISSQRKDARFAVVLRMVEAGTLLTTITRPESSGDFFAVDATQLSDYFSIILILSVLPINIWQNTSSDLWVLISGSISVPPPYL